MRVIFAASPHPIRSSLTSPASVKHHICILSKMYSVILSGRIPQPAQSFPFLPCECAARQCLCHSVAEPLVLGGEVFVFYFSFPFKCTNTSYAQIGVRFRSCSKKEWISTPYIETRLFNFYMPRIFKYILRIEGGKGPKEQICHICDFVPPLTSLRHCASSSNCRVEFA